MEGIRSMRLSEHAPVDSIDPDEGVTSLQPKVHTYFLCLISGCILWLCFIFFKKSETTLCFLSQEVIFWHLTTLESFWNKLNERK